MLPGITGSLVAPSFLATVLGPECLAAADVTRRLRVLHAWWRRAERTLGPAAGLRAVADVGALPLLSALGYETSQLEPRGSGLVGHAAQRRGATIVLRVGRWGEDPQDAWRDTVRASRIADADWGVIYTGPRLRLVDAARTWSRRALDFDLSRALHHETSAAVLLALLDAVGTRDGSSTALHAIVARSDQHGVEVCESLGTGVLTALTALVGALDTDRRRRPRADEDRDVFEQAVTLVYRLLFLLFAEARSMVPVWHRVYRDGYTVDALCRRYASQPHRRGLWKAFQAIARLAHAGCQAGDLVVTPFNGRLFSPQHTPLAERATVPDIVIGNAVLSLAMRTTTAGQARIAYVDLGVEQLGAVYERVLEYEPSRVSGQLCLTRTSHDRKSTGSFYTPRSMTEFLVRRALHPLVHRRTAAEMLQLRVLDPAMGSGAFLVGACRHLAEAVGRALDAEGSSPAAAPTRHAQMRRMVAQRCLFGVDINPMAVQLARLSLWLASLSSDVPLTFLDHHLAVGNSLVGASLADLARNPCDRRPDPDRLTPLLPFDAESQIAGVIPDRFRIALEPGDTPAAVRAKERLLASLSAPGTPLDAWRRAADLWCAAWFWPDSLGRGIYGDVFASLTGRGGALSTEQRERVLHQAAALAAEHRFFHWELAFPEVFFTPDGRRDPDGGFDAVIGNPPWDVLRADRGTAESRAQSRPSHRAQLRFFRESRIYRFQGGGHANRYQLFVERALQLVRPGGRLALILPSGLASDHGSAAVRRALLDRLQLDRVFGFDNHEVIFPIHRDVRFLLLTGTKGRPTERVTGVFGRSNAAWLDQLPDSASDDPAEARPIELSRAFIESLDPEHVAIPWLVRREDLDLLATIASSAPALADPKGWHVRFGRELNATDDRHHFVRRPTAPRTGLLTIVEGKHLEPFRVQPDASTLAISARVAATLLDPSRTFECSRLAYRDVASATNKVTLIAALLPPGTISTHTLFCSKSPLGDDARYCLLALLNSLVANYLARLQVTTHVTCALMARLPVPRPRSSSPAFKALASLARSLERTGIAGRDAAYARFNAIVAHLYGLTHAQYDDILSTFPLLSRDLLAACSSAYLALRAGDTKAQRGDTELF